MNKESPIASFVTGWLQGTDSVGEDFKLTDEIVSRFVPMLVGDLKETLAEEGLMKTLGYKALGVMGFGVQTYSGTPSVKGDKSGLPDLPDLPSLPSLPDLPSL